MKPRTIIDPDKDTPRTDAVAKMIGRLACQLKTGELELHAFAIVAQHELDKLGAMERELNAALTQPPAPSKEMEERINRISREAGDWAERTYGQSGHLLHYITRQAARSALETLAAELGKERAAEVATLRAELADRWRDITANEQQTQRLLNDIENLRAEIAELKARP